MNDERSTVGKQEAARKIRATLVELWNVAKVGGLEETAQHLENSIAEADRAIAGDPGTTSRANGGEHTQSRLSSDGPSRQQPSK
jgi:hypothetical protein